MARGRAAHERGREDGSAGGSDAVPFGPLLRRLRREVGLTQEALAERSGLSVEAISALERGWRQTPRASTLELVADGLGLTGQDRERLVAVARRPGRPRAATPARPGPAPTVSLTPLVGRQDEVAAVRRLLLGAEPRLVTLTGPGGVGKTRVALAAAHGLHDPFDGRVVAVDLAPLSDPDLVPGAVGQRMGLVEEFASEIPAIVAAVGGRPLLLVLDNFDHVVAAGPWLTGVLAACPELRALVTSRASLRVRGEHELPVDPLPLPDTASEHLLDAVAESPAVELFRQRAAALSGFELTTDNAADVSRICRRLDGLPLALELAAGWTRLLGARDLLARIDQGLPVLVDGPRDLPERQRTMAATVHWSYQLLGPAEQRLFRWLAVFVADVSLDTVLRVCSGVVDDVPRVLAGLCERSLVRRHQAADRATRVGMLETIRFEARRLLDESGDREVAAGGHAAHFLAISVAAGAGLTGPDQARWLARLDREYADVTEALRELDRRGEIGPALELAGGIWRFWERTGRRREGLGWLHRLLERDGGPAGPRACCLAGAGSLSLRLGEVHAAADYYGAAMALHESMQDPRGQAQALGGMGVALFEMGERERAVAVMEDCLDRWRELRDQGQVALAFNNLATALYQLGDVPRALALHQDALGIRRALGDTLGVAQTLSNMGDLARGLGEPDRAQKWLEESLELCRSLPDPGGLGHVLCNLGDVARDRGRIEDARARYAESLRIRLELQDRAGAALCLEGLAGVAWAGGDGELAARLYSAAAASRAALDLAQRPRDRADHDRIRDELLAALGEAVFTAAWRNGAELSLELAADLAAPDAHG